MHAHSHPPQYMEGGNLAVNIAARRVSWWKRGRKVRAAWRQRSAAVALPPPCKRTHTHRCACCSSNHPAQIALDVARGLVFLHSRRIIHFDIKASAHVVLCLCGCCSYPGVSQRLAAAHTAPATPCTPQSPNILLAR